MPEPMVTVRYFAAAAEAAGTSSEQVEATTLGGLLAEVVGRHGEALGMVLGRCSVLLDGRRADDPATELTPGATLDVLPPFAGG